MSLIVVHFFYFIHRITTIRHIIIDTNLKKNSNVKILLKLRGIKQNRNCRHILQLLLNVSETMKARKPHRIPT